ncbi:MAG: M23 family metallopeptidase [Bacteroidetes bacterium]|nr:MAG: M23 family metallopeptidase [Bacteroidota bacterium]
MQRIGFKFATYIVMEGMIRFFKNYIRLVSFTINCLYICVSTDAQTVKYPQNYFRNPLDIPMELVANFGELRSNHWHMGLDIRTNQKENLPVYAAAEGYIAYVGVRPQSFGRFIIINHPNGYSTLYAHLNDFYPALHQYVLDEQYKNESWQVELDLPKDKFKVSKGQFIAYSGNTGGSQGPHVHFEIRETKTDRSLNPLLFGMPIKDDVPPTISKLGIYDRSTSTYAQTPQLFSLKNTDSGYIIPKIPVIKTGLNKISFAVEAIDRFSGSQNPNGIYTTRIFLDDERIAGFTLDQIDYRESEYINAQIDYRYYKAGKGYLQHISPLPGEKGRVYHIYNGDGIINLNDTSIHEILIEVGDADENYSKLIFKIQYKDSLAVNKPGLPGSGEFVPNFVNVLEKPDFEAYLPEGCIYDTIKPVYYRSNATNENAVSALHQLNDNSIPVHEEMTVKIKPNKEVRKEWQNKIIIQRNGSYAILKPKWEGQWLSFKTGAFGTFVALLDLSSPILNDPDVYKKGKGDTLDLSPATRILFTPTDISGIRKFRAELDSNWLMFTNDKGRTWIYNFDERCPYGIHHLKIAVEDLVGNTTTKEWWFKKYPYTPPPPKKKKKTSKKKTTTLKKKPVTKKK